jgi:hypothetical protein
VVTARSGGAGGRAAAVARRVRSGPAGRRRTAVVRCPSPRSHAAPDDVACSHRWFHPTPRGVAGSDPHRQPARSSGCCWVPPAARPADRSRSCSRTSRRNRWVCQPRVEQIHLLVLQPDRDRPDHRCDIFPALITKRPASASIACKLRRLPDITLPRRPSADSTSSSSGLRTGQRPDDRRRPRPVRCGSCRHARESSWCSAHW